MNKCIFLISLIITLPSVAEPLSAVMNFESMAITADGVKKQTQFQERFIRDENTVWSERIIPETVHREHPHDDNGHEHNLNFSTAGKWLVRDATNRVQFRLVQKNEKHIIEPRITEYGTLGFDGEWETAYYLVNRSRLKHMKPLHKGTAEGTQWYEKKDGKNFTRILWNEKNEIPLSIETGSLDGTTYSKITINLLSPPANLPWNNLGGYQTIAYEDLLD